MSHLLRSSKSYDEFNERADALSRFEEAKGNIKTLFSGVKRLITESSIFLKGPELIDLIESDVKDNLSKAVSQIDYIREMIERDQMKVAFFGRTSSGKSSVSNAILRHKILPVGMGDTTNCFISIQGTDQEEPYMIHPMSNEKHNVRTIAQLANALDKNKLERSSQLSVYWPRSKVPLLCHDIMFIDSPGISVESKLDNWIDKYCLDADVFIFVANAEATLMEAEKQFFFKVSKQLSKPNIFILQNKWDLADDSDIDFDSEDVKRQHLDRSIDFLVNELKVVENKEEALNRIFFVSAREELVTRLADLQGTPVDRFNRQSPAFIERHMAFEKFEQIFQRTVSESAIQTKFEKHTERGKTMICGIKDIIQSANISIVKTIKQRSCECDAKRNIHKNMKRDLKKMKEVMNNKMQEISKELEAKVRTAFDEEISRLSILVDDFSKAFPDHGETLEPYREALFVYVEEGLKRNIEGRCTSTLLQEFDVVKSDMANTMDNIVPEEWKQQHSTSISTLLNRQPPRLNYNIACDHLFSKFKEQLEFQFSLGFMKMFNRILSPSNTQSMLRKLNGVVSVPGTNQVPDSQNMILPLLNTAITVSSQSPLTIMLIGGVFWRMIGWRLIAVVGGIYGAVYMYEKLTWNNKAKERVFKEQFVDYATRKLKSVVPLISHNSSSQVVSELNQTFASICRAIEVSIKDVDKDVSKTSENVKILKSKLDDSRVILNRLLFQENEFDSFVGKYLMKL